MKKAMVVFLCVCLLVGSCCGAFAAVPDNAAVLKAPAQRFSNVKQPSKTALRLPAKEKEAKIRELNAWLQRVNAIYAKHLPNINRIGGEMQDYQILLYFIRRFQLPVSPIIINLINARINKLKNDLNEENKFLNDCQAVRRAILNKIKEIRNSNSAA